MNRQKQPTTLGMSTSSAVALLLVGLIAGVSGSREALVSTRVPARDRRAHSRCLRTPRPQQNFHSDWPFREYALRIGAAGAIACSVSHALVVPFDVIKTQMQMQPALNGPRAAASALISQGGLLSLLRGVRPTALGYFLQGGVKFGSYESLKHIGESAFC